MNTSETHGFPNPSSAGKHPVSPTPFWFKSPLHCYYKIPELILRYFIIMCAREDLNLHALNGHSHLKAACLPIPPPAHDSTYHIQVICFFQLEFTYTFVVVIYLRYKYHSEGTDVFEIFSPLQEIAADMRRTLTDPREWVWGIVSLLCEAAASVGDMVWRLGGRLF